MLPFKQSLVLNLYTNMITDASVTIFIICSYFTTLIAIDSNSIIPFFVILYDEMMKGCKDVIVYLNKVTHEFNK